MYFVPGGRIGIRKPQEIDVWSNSCTLLSADHTLMVDVHETIRLSPQDDAHIWAKDQWGPVKQSERVATGLVLPGFEVRRFRDAGYGTDLNYAAEAMVVRDARWMGEVKVTTGNHGGLTKQPGGQVARWLPLMASVFASIQVRPQLPVADALAELGVSVDTSGLNPRLVGNKLILSLYTPTSALESWASNRSHISLDDLSVLPTAPPGDQQTANDELFAISRKTRGSSVIDGRHCKGITQSEMALTGVPDLFSTRIRAFGRKRSQELVALYGAADREPILRALHQAFQSLSLSDRI